MVKKITIAIQRKGRLFDSSKELLIKSGINFSTSGEKLLARSSNMNIDILLVRDDDIPSLVSKGVADLGIVGKNVLAEQAANSRKITAKSVLNLGFSKCRLAFAKPLTSKIRSLNNKVIAITLLFNDLILEVRGFANANLHFENPRFNTDLAVIFRLFAACSARTFFPTIPRSATPFDTSEGISSSLTNNISIFIFEERAKSFSPLVLKLIPDLINSSLLLSNNLPFR